MQPKQDHIEEVFNGSALSPVAAEAAEEYGAAAPSRPYEYQTTATVMAQTAFLLGVLPGSQKKS